MQSLYLQRIKKENADMGQKKQTQFKPNNSSLRNQFIPRGSSINKAIGQNLNGMADSAITDVFYLHFAGGAFGQDVFGRCRFQCVLQALGNLRRQIAIFLLHPERPGKTAAARLKVSDFDAAKLLQQSYTRTLITYSA